MDMKKVTFAVLVVAVCMTAVMAASKPPQPKPVVDVPPKTGAKGSDAPAPAPKASKSSGEDTPSSSPAAAARPTTSSADSPPTPSSADAPANHLGEFATTSTIPAAPAPAPSSANTVVGSLAGASLVSFLALFM